MDKIIEELKIKDLIKNCENGCDNCDRKLARVCEETGWSLVMLGNADKKDLQSVVMIKENWN